MRERLRRPAASRRMVRLISLTSSVRQTRPPAPAAAPERSRASRPEGRGAPSTVTTAIVFATAPAEDSNGVTGPAAALPWGDGTVLRRLLSQLADLGVPSAHVLTRPGWEEALRPSLEGVGLSAEVRSSSGTSDDLREVARVTGAGQGGVLVTAGDVVTHRRGARRPARRSACRDGSACLEPPHREGVRLPRTGGQGPRRQRRLAVPRRSPPEPQVPGNPQGGRRRPRQARRDRGKARRPDGAAAAAGLGERAALQARELETAPRPARERPGGRPGRRRRRPRDGDVVLSSDDEVELGRWISTAPQDASSLLLVGLVRSGAHVGISHLRDLFWARPLSRDAAARAAEEIMGYDEDQRPARLGRQGERRLLHDLLREPLLEVRRALGGATGLLSEPGHDGLARHRGARRGRLRDRRASGADRGRGPAPDRLHDRLRRRPARPLHAHVLASSAHGSTRSSTATKEYVVFAGLAIGASRTGDSVWLLAGSALALQTVRHAIDFSYPIAQHQVLAGARQPPLEQPADRLAAALQDSDAG